MSIPKSAKPTWMRLTPEAWAMIRDAYISGVSAPVLARRWRVSASSIYRHASLEGWTKRQAGAVFSAARIAAERKSAADHLQEGAALAASLPDVACDPGGHAAGLGRRALGSIGSALDEGRVADAKGYAALAEQLRKLAGRERADDARRPAAGAQEESLEAFVADRWRYIAEIAAAMLHNPDAAPAVFEQQIAAWRRDHLGEDDAESRARAKNDAAYALGFFETGFATGPDLDALAVGAPDED